MLSRSAMRASAPVQTFGRRAFSSTRSQMASPYHYPEGPRSNLPFNTQTKFFAVRYWSFMGWWPSMAFSWTPRLTTYSHWLPASLRHCWYDLPTGNPPDMANTNNTTVWQTNKNQ
ncbi:hypothetical protein K461DRAFT_274687 [Myriangium duriaei CBS 260.36]|uniref:Uncharacterized protein n=1 Tax=Myriangium duriaei CBS 260.36 TaxID=1168546 RepID=A0A9P4J5X3_9PEZI|nr:hypothetical protein K461DRAFT_274687 [Myriangium duriaei CBS 260.36]